MIESEHQSILNDVAQNISFSHRQGLKTKRKRDGEEH